MTITEPDAPAVRTKATRRRRWVAIAAVAGWTAVLGLGLLHAAGVEWMGDLGCEANVGDSNYGAHGWSTLPPGPTCTYTQRMNGFDRVDGPTPVMSIWLLGLALGAIVCLALVRRARRA